MSFPTSPVANSITITSITPTFTSITQSLKRQVRTRGAQRWSISAGYPPMNRTEFAPLWAFAQKQKGQFNTFPYVPPVYGSTSGTATGTARVNNSAGYIVGTTVIALDGLTGNLKAGDFIKFTGHDKVYSLLLDSTTTINIEPALQAPINNDEVIIYNQVPFTVAFTTDNQAMSVTIGGWVSYDIDLIEVA